MLEPSMFAVETKKLTKRYGKTYALKILDFSIDKGEIMVLLGVPERTGCCAYSGCKKVYIMPEITRPVTKD